MPIYELKSCPFCGDAPKIFPWHGGVKNKCMVACMNEACQAAPEVVGNSGASAAFRWNVRPHPVKIHSVYVPLATKARTVSARAKNK